VNPYLADRGRYTQSGRRPPAGRLCTVEIKIARKGIRDGDKIILQPPVNLAESEKVQIIPAPPAATP